MTVSKTTTQERAWEKFQGCMSSRRSDRALSQRIAEFADSLSQEATAELQKENARLEKLVEWAAKVLLQHMNDEDYEASLAGIYATLTEAALSKEKE